MSLDGTAKDMAAFYALKVKERKAAEKDEVEAWHIHNNAGLRTKTKRDEEESAHSDLIAYLSKLACGGEK